MLQIFRLIAVVEGTLLPAVLVLALVHGLAGVGGSAVAVVGAAHGAVFTAYLVLLYFVRRALGWSARTVGIAFVASLVPFAPWAFEREIRADIRRYGMTGVAGQESGVTG